MSDKQFMEQLAGVAETLTDGQKAYLMGTLQGLALARGLENRAADAETQKDK